MRRVLRGTITADRSVLQHGRSEEIRLLAAPELSESPDLGLEPRPCLSKLVKVDGSRALGWTMSCASGCCVVPKYQRVLKHLTFKWCHRES